MSQIAMRAPHRDMRGIVVQGIPYEVNENGVVNAHMVHEAALRSLGFHACVEESPEAPAVALMTDEEVKIAQKAVADARKAKAVQTSEDAKFKEDWHDDSKSEKAHASHAPSSPSQMPAPNKGK